MLTPPPLTEPVPDEYLPDWRDDVIIGVIYLVCFTDPATGEHALFGHAGHYLGWTGNLEKRLKRHAAGHGANLLRHVRAAGLEWELSRTYIGTRNRERQLKESGGHTRKCPRCGARPAVVFAHLQHARVAKGPYVLA